MNKHEAKFCTALGKWWDNVGCKVLEPLEYKIEAKISMGNEPFNYKSGIKENQTPTLIAYNTRPMHWKISDLDRMSTKHYDLHFSHPDNTLGLFAFLWIRRGNKTFYLIDPAIIQARREGGEKSLKEQDAQSISFYIGNIK